MSLPPLPAIQASDSRARRAPTTRRGRYRTIVAWLPLGIGLFLSSVFPAAIAESAAAGPDDSCAAGTVRIASHHFLVDGIVLDHLQGRVAIGDNFTVVVALAGCDGVPHRFAMEFEMPPCNSPLRKTVVSVLEGLNSGNVSDDSESALVRDVQAAMACEPFHVAPTVLGAAAAGSVSAVGAAACVVAWRRRRRT
ncbi:MAG: hypothetical protein HYT80_10495 [Euryarchaeota archaeon]|nr:hypothetical protein [Euryarchaeota archaeon]